MCVLDAYFGYGYNHVSILIWSLCILHVRCMFCLCVATVYLFCGGCACTCACVCEGFVVLGQGHGDKISTFDLGLRNGLGPARPMSRKFSTISHEERERSTEALRWAWDALQTPGDVGDQELVSTLGLAP